MPQAIASASFGCEKVSASCCTVRQRLAVHTYLHALLHPALVVRDIIEQAGGTVVHMSRQGHAAVGGANEDGNAPCGTHSTV